MKKCIKNCSMKVLSIIRTTKSSSGGPPSVLKNQLEVLNRDKKIVEVLELDTLTNFSLFKSFLFKSHRKKIYSFLTKFDLVHFHEIWSIKNVFIVYFLNKLLIKFFFVGHGYLDKWSINQKLFKKKSYILFFLQKAYDSAYASFFSTKDEYLESKKNIKSHKIFIIPNGISLNKYKKRKLVRKVKKKILFFGRIHPKKGLELLIEVIRQLPNDYFDEFTFNITGPGEAKHILKTKQLIKKYSLDKYISINDPVYGESKIPYLNKHDIFILPSFEEGDSIALKEALASSLPVIISKQCRLDVVKDYNAGIVVETNKKSIINALIKLKNVDLISMGNQARNLVEEKFDNEICSNRLYQIYQDIYNNTENSLDWIKN